MLSTNKRTPLRIGLLIDSYAQPLWIDKILEEITRDGITEIALVILNSASSEDAAHIPHSNFFSRCATWFKNRRALAFAAYERFDSLRYRDANDPFQRVDIRQRLIGCPTILITPRQVGFSDYFDEVEAAEIKAHNLDVALRFGFRILKGDALSIARFGVWSYHHGDNAINRGGPAGHWEVFENQTRTGAVLQRLTEELDGGVILGRCYAGTNFISPTVNRARAASHLSES